MTPTPTTQAPAAAPGSAAPLVSHRLAAFALALLLGLQPVTTDVYLPALPMLARDLAAPMSAAQLTMSALILAFGVAQMFWGPVADRVGRRPVLITGLLLYTAASIGSMLAGGIGWLVLWRVLQGATMAAAVVCARAIVRDLYEPLEGARVMSLALSGLGVIAIAGPALGGVVAALGGWRAALAVVAAFGALTLAFIAWRLPETLLHKNPDATRAGPLLAQWSQIARHPTFIAWTLLVSATYGGLFTILAGSSFTYIDVLGLSPGWYGLAMASGSLSYLAGTFVCRRWIVRHGIRGAVARGGGF
ncbi:MAG TPA: MFS transporter, partial [Rubrivivax sp.]|nr:MFS transporter [Rubrivivax sp.]